MGLINYKGDSKLLKRICALLKVTDVQDGQGQSLVDSNGIAHVTGGGGGSSTLAGLSDVDTTGASDGDVLVYNGTTSKWEDETLANVAFSGSYNDLSNTPTIPDELADLADDSTHRVVTDSEKTAWSAKVDDNPTFSEASTRANIASGESFATILGKIKKFFTDLATVAFSGSYTDLSNQPTIPSVSANPATTTATLTGIEIDGTNYAVQGGSANVQSDWNETDTTADDYIKNKPTMWDMNHNGPYIGAAIVGQFDPQTLQPLWQATQFFPRIETHETNPDYAVGSNDHNEVCWTEYKPGSTYSLPTNHYYNIVTMVGDSSDRVSQIAMCSQDNSVYYRVRNTGTWTSWVSLKNVQADWNASSGEAAILNKPTIPDISTKVTKAGDTMTGALSFNADMVQIEHRNNSSWYCYEAYETAGDEALVQATQQGKSSFIWVNGEDRANVANNRWQSLVPGLQVKKNCVAIGKLIGQNVDPSYKLEVEGTARISGNTKIANGLFVYGRAAGGGDDEGIVIDPFSNGYAGLCLGNPTGRRSVFYLNSNKIFWRYVASSTAYDIEHPAKSGTIALTSDVSEKVSKSGDLMTGTLQFRDSSSGGQVWCPAQQQLYLAASHESNYYLFLGVTDSTWTLCPNGKDYLRLGTSNHRWNQIYSNSTSISTSDRKEKKDIEPLDEFARELIMSLNPVSFKFKNGESGRTHYGMIAQDVEDSLEELGITPMDIAAFCKDQKTVQVKETVNKQIKFKDVKVKGEYVYGLRYEEFIAPLIKTVQLQQEEINLLKQRIDILEGK